MRFEVCDSELVGCFVYSAKATRAATFQTFNEHIFLGLNMIRWKVHTWYGANLIHKCMQANASVTGTVRVL